MDFSLIRNRISDIKILVIGDFMIDHYMYGTCERISPEAPVPVVDIKNEFLTLGGAGNVVKNLFGLGVTPDVLTIIGNDKSGEELIYLLEEIGVDKSGVFQTETRKTSKKTRVLVSNHQLIRFDNETKINISLSEEENIKQFLKKRISNYNIVLISDYNKGVLTEDILQFIITLCNANNIKSIVDPKGNDFSKYQGASIIKPNRKEASIATGLNASTNENLKIVANKLKMQLNCETVIITLSEEGMAICGDEFEIIPTKAKEVFDVTGAGDTVLAVLGVAISVGYNIKDACNFANHAAALVVSKVGSVSTTLDEIFNHIEKDL